MPQLKLKNVRFAWTDGLFEASSFDDKGEPAFNTKVLIPKNHPQVKEIKAAIDAVAKEQWGTLAAAKLKSITAKQDIFFRDGDDDEKEELHGNYVISARNKVRPPVFDADGSTPLVVADGRPYSGSYGAVIIDVWSQDKKKFGTDRVNARLMGAMFWRDGEAFTGARIASEQDFADMSEGADHEIDAETEEEEADYA